MENVEEYLEECIQGVFADTLGMQLGNKAAHHLRILLESAQLSRQGVLNVLQLDGDSYTKIEGKLWGLFWRTPTVKVIDIVCRALSTSAKTKFALYKGDVEQFFIEYPVYHKYKDLMCTYRQQFSNLFLNKTCGSSIFRRYAADQDLIDDFIASPRLDFAAMSQPIAQDTKCQQQNAEAACPSAASSSVAAGWSGEEKKKYRRYMRYLRGTELNAMQRECLVAIDGNRENVLLSAPTGAGKTLVGILAILRCLMDEPAPRIYYIAPIKALIREKVSDIRRAINAEGNTQPPKEVSVIGLSSDVTVREGEIVNSQVCIGTPEKLDVCLRNGLQFNLIIIDEVHMLNDERGDVLEAIVARARARIVGMSATIPNLNDVRKFLDVPEHNCFKYPDSYRPVKLVYEHNRMPISAETLDAVIQRVIKEPGPTLLFVNERKTAHAVANRLCSFIRRPEKSAGVQENASNSIPRNASAKPSAGMNCSGTHIGKEAAAALNSISGSEMLAMVNDRVGVHHAGLSLRERSCIETLFNECLLDIVVCTTTLAWGINMPCRTVVMYGHFTPLEIIQMSGRAGRPGASNSAKSQSALGCYYGPSPNMETSIESYMLKSICFHLNAEIVSGTVKTLADGARWLKRTFYYQRMQLAIKNEAGAVRDVDTVQSVDITAQRAEDRAKHIVYSALKELEERGCLKGFRPTLLGRISYKYYVRPEEMSIIAKINPFFDEGCILDLVGDIVETPAIDIPNIEVPFPTDSTTSKVIQFILGGHRFPIDTCGFLQNVRRVTLALFEYALAKDFAVCACVLKIFHQVGAALDITKGARRQRSCRSTRCGSYESECYCAWQPSGAFDFEHENSGFKDITIQAYAVRKAGVVFASIKLYIPDCLLRSSGYLLITDELDLRIYYTRPLEHHPSGMLEFYVEAVCDNFLNLKLISTRHPAVLARIVAITKHEEHKNAITLRAEKPAVHDKFDYAVVLNTENGDAAPRTITYDRLNEILHGGVLYCEKVHCPRDSKCLIDYQEIEPASQINTSAEFRVRDDIITKIKNNHLKLLLTQTHAKDDIYAIKAAVLGCLARRIEFNCVGLDYRALAGKTQWIVACAVAVHDLHDFVRDDLYANLLSRSASVKQLVIFDSDPLAKRALKQFNSIFASTADISKANRPVFDNNRTDGANIVFSSRRTVGNGRPTVHLVSARIRYFECLDLASKAAQLFVYTDRFSFRSVKIQHALDSQHRKSTFSSSPDGAPVSAGDLLRSHNLRPNPIELEYYSEHALGIYSEYSAVIKKYTLSIALLERILVTIKDGIGLKSLFKTVISECLPRVYSDYNETNGLVAYFTRDMQTSHSLDPCAAQIKKWLASESGVSFKNEMKRLLRCVIDVCYISKRFKSIVASIYSIQKINEGCGNPFTIEVLTKHRETTAPPAVSGVGDSLSDYLTTNRLCKKQHVTSGNAQSDERIQFLVTTTQPPASGITLYVIDEFFNFEMIEVVQRSKIDITWPGKCYVLCDFGNGSVFVK